LSTSPSSSSWKRDDCGGRGEGPGGDSRGGCGGPPPPAAVEGVTVLHRFPAVAVSVDVHVRVLVVPRTRPSRRVVPTPHNHHPVPSPRRRERTPFQTSRATTEHSRTAAKATCTAPGLQRVTPHSGPWPRVEPSRPIQHTSCSPLSGWRIQLSAWTDAAGAARTKLPCGTDKVATDAPRIGG